MDYEQAPVPAFLFDLDGTLIDSVYQHVTAWHAALAAIGIDLSVWRIHRRIGMSGGLFVQALLRETGRTLTADEIRLLSEAHAAEYIRQSANVTALPGASELLATLTATGVKWAIATSGYAATARSALALLGVGEDTPMVTRDLVRHAKPDPDLFLARRAARRDARGGPAIGRVRPGGARAGRRLPCLRRPGRDAGPPLRDRRPLRLTTRIGLPAPAPGWPAVSPYGRLAPTAAHSRRGRPRCQ
jgi:beta-phosphoglucomutase-like phosphatase (HAD superfamily)